MGPYHVARLRACQRLAPSGIIVTGIAVAGEVEDRPWTAVDEEDIRIRVALPKKRYQHLRAEESWPAILRLLDEMRPVAVAMAGYGMPESRQILKWCRRRGALRVLMSESKADDASRTWLKELAKRFLISKFDSAICGGTPHRRYLEQLGMRPGVIFDKYDVVDNEAFALASGEVQADPGAFRHLPGLDDGRPFFLASSRLIERKNLHNLLLAFDAYRRSQPTGWRLVILGVGDQEAALKELVRERNIPDVVFAGFHQMNALVAYYALAAAFIHPALQEQWGLVVNEAMACGLPVLVSRTVGAACDLVKDGVNGFTFDPHDVAQLASLMMRFSSANFPSAAFGSASREIISQWAPEHFARNFWLAVEAAGGLRHF